IRCKALAAGPGEVRDIDAGGEWMNVRMLVALRLIYAVAAGEDDVRPRQQQLLVMTQLRRCEPKIRKFVHAVIYDRRRLDMGRDRIDHRRVEPEDRPCFDRVYQKQMVEQSRYRRR